MKKLLFLLLILTSLSIHSQKEANFWYFGHNAGLDFTSGSPVPLNNGAFQTAEGSASISDINGNLLFYTDGSNVFDKNHTIMPNGSGLLGNPSSAQSAIIVPKPLDPDTYYIFTVGNEGGSNGVNFSEIDMTLNGGFGDISIKNTSLTSAENAQEKITSIKGTDCNTFWVITSDRNSFYSYKIDINGVDTTSKISPHNNNLNNLRGYLKVSPNGETLVNASASQGTYIFDFNASNGEVTNGRTIIAKNSGKNGYGVEFSRNGEKLYISTGTHSQPVQGGGINSPSFASIYQYNLSNNNIADIITSENEIFTTNSGYRGALQLAPNGKIYYARSWQTSLGVINFPEKNASEVDFVENGLSLNGQTCREGLPPFIQSFFLPIEIKDEDTDEVLNNKDLQYCIGETRTIAPDVVSGTGVTYKWEFEDTGGTTTQIHNDRILSLPNLTTANTGKYILTVSLTDNCGNTTTLEGTFNVGVFEAAVATPTNKLFFCDAVTPDGFNEFDLKSEKDNVILGALSPTAFDVLYFLDEDDAKNNVTANALTDGKYTNAVAFDTKTIYARVHNKSAPNACSDVTSFDVQVTGLPVPQDPTDYVICDDITSAGGNTDGITESFKLEDRDSQILGSLTGYTVSYHTSKNGAENKTDTIDKTINRTVNNTETVFVRVENNENSACADFSKELKLVVAPVPDTEATININECISASLVNPTINLTVSEISVLKTTNIDDVYFKYYRDPAATNQITEQEVKNYSVVPDLPNNPVYIKTFTKLNDCDNGTVTQLNIFAATLSPQTYDNTFAPECDDYTGTIGSDTDLTTTFEKSYFETAETQIMNELGNPPNRNILFYETQTDRTNSVHAININNYRNDITKIDKSDIPNGIKFPIYYKIISTINNDCQGIGQFYLQIVSVPEATTPSNFELCDDFDSSTGSSSHTDGINIGINLRDKISEIFAGTSQTETDFDVTFYKSEADVISGNNAIPLAETTNYKNDAPAGWVIGTVSTQTIYVRVQNKITGCFNNHVSFDININPLPTITTAIPDIEVCDTPTIGDPDSRNGLAQGIDLSLRDADVLNGRDSNDFKVSYHRTRAEATAGLVSTELNKNSYDNNPNFTTLTNGIGEEILYISIENRNTGCKYGISTLKIIVYPEPNIPAIIDNFSTCDHDNNGLGDDTDGIVEDIALINKKEQVLANYPTTEHDNFKVTFHTSKALAESGANPIDENKYKNTQNNQIIYVRVEDTRTGCINDDLTFEIIVNPLPTFDEIDTPQIVCLNNLPLRIEVQNALTSYTYTWKDENGATLNTNPDDDFLDITKGGNYSVTATMKDGTGCERIREFRINESNIATITEADISIVDDSDNNSITIDTTNLGIGDYEFALFDKVTNTFIIDFQDEPFFEDLKGGIYSIYVRDKNGCDVNNIPVEIEVPVVEFPKFFTPNGDGKNDVWSIKGVNSFFFPGSTIYIFNRYGKVVGNISVNNNTWDGTYKGKPLPSDDYWFNIQLINKDGTARKPRKGHFSLLRTSN